jgi:hypothetical protein
VAIFEVEVEALSAEQQCSHAMFRDVAKQASELSGTRWLRDMHASMPTIVHWRSSSSVDETSASVLFRLQEPGARPQNGTSSSSLLPYR